MTDLIQSMCGVAISIMALYGLFTLQSLSAFNVFVLYFVLTVGVVHVIIGWVQ